MMEVITIPTTRCYWEPRPDISVYELAICLGPLLAATGGSAHLVSEFAAGLPEFARRNFRFETDSQSRE